MARIEDNPCLLLDDHDRTDLGVPLPGAWSRSDDGTRSCLWTVNGGYGVGVWTDRALGPPSVMGGRPARVRGHRATQFRRENGAVCYTVVAVKPKRWLVLVSDADSSPENRPRLCRVGKRFARAMVTHVG